MVRAHKYDHWSIIYSYYYSSCEESRTNYYRSHFLSIALINRQSIDFEYFEQYNLNDAQCFKSATNERMPCDDFICSMISIGVSGNLNFNFNCSSLNWFASIENGLKICCSQWHAHCPRTESIQLQSIVHAETKTVFNKDGYKSKTKTLYCCIIIRCKMYGVHDTFILWQQARNKKKIMEELHSVVGIR